MSEIREKKIPCQIFWDILVHLLLSNRHSKVQALTLEENTMEGCIRWLQQLCSQWGPIKLRYLSIMDATAILEDPKERGSEHPKSNSP